MLLSQNIDFARNALLNARFQELATAPTSPVKGQFYLTTAAVLRVWTGSTWRDVGKLRTAAEVIALLLTVDGPGSGLDADLLDGLEASAFRRVADQVPADQVSGLTAAIDAQVLARFDADAPDEDLDSIAEALQRIRDNADLLASLQAGNAKRYSETFGDGAATSFTFAHGLGSVDVVTQVRVVATGELVLADVRPLDADTAALTTATAPASGAWRITVLA